MLKRVIAYPYSALRIITRQGSRDAADLRSQSVNFISGGRANGCLRGSGGNCPTNETAFVFPTIDRGREIVSTASRRSAPASDKRHETSRVFSRWSAGVIDHEARDILARELTYRKEHIVASREAAEKALTEAKAAGRKLMSRGIGHGPGAIQTARRGATPTPASDIARTQPDPQSTSPGATASALPGHQTGTPNPAPQREIGGEREPVGRVADPTPAPPPPPLPAEDMQRPSSSGGVGGQSLTELLRGQARLREVEARRKLRKAALARLSRLDIAIVTDAAGWHAVVKGGLADDQMRALMDPAFDTEIQAELGRLATAQAQQAAQAGVAGSQPSMVPQGGAASLPASSVDEDYERLQRQRAHQQGVGGIGRP